MVDNGNGFTMPQMQYSGREGFGRLFGRLKQNIRDTWGTKTAVNVTDEEMKILENFLEEGQRKMLEGRAAADKISTEAVNFTIHEYRQGLGLDLPLAYLMPWHFWHGRTYTKWIKRIATKPGVVAAYANYRDTMEKLHADMPEWWKYQLNSNDLGIAMFKDNPLYFN